MVGKEQQTFAVHQKVVSSSLVLEGMCNAIVEKKEDYRIELSAVDPHAFAGILAWMYGFLIDHALEFNPGDEGSYMGDLYIFAVTYGVMHVRDIVLRELERRYGVRELLRAAVGVYNALGRETPFSLFFTSHVVEKVVSHSQRHDHGFNPGGNDVDIAMIAAEGGDLSADFMVAVLHAMLTNRLSITSVVEEPVVVPPSQQTGWGASTRPPIDPGARGTTATALRDWHGGGFRGCCFRKARQSRMWW